MRSGAADGDPDPILPWTAKRFLPPRQATASFSGGRQSPRQAGLSPRGRRRLFLTINGPSRLRLPAGGCGAALPGQGGPAGRRAALSRTPGGDAGGASTPPLGPPFPAGGARHLPRRRKRSPPGRHFPPARRGPAAHAFPRPLRPDLPLPRGGGVQSLWKACALPVKRLSIASFFRSPAPLAFPHFFPHFHNQDSTVPTMGIYSS